MLALKNFPSQRIQNKSKKWAKECVDAVSMLLQDNDGTLRKSRQNKVVNYNLYNNILDPEDMARISNPFGIPDLTSPTVPQNHPIANVKIDLLYGEYLKRDFPYSLRVANYDAVSEKEEALKEKIDMLLMETLKQENPDQQQLEIKIQELQNDLRTYQDKREILGNRILNSETRKVRFDKKIADGFMDLMIAGEMMFYVDVIGKKSYKDIVFEKLNPLNVYTLRSGDSPFIHDSDIIIVERYMSPGKIIDNYWDELSKDDIDKIEGKYKPKKNGSSIGENHLDQQAIPSGWIRNADSEIYDTERFESGEWLHTNRAGMSTDMHGNHRVLMVFWKSYREMKLVTFLDENGNEKCRIEDRQYKENPFLGETAESFWITEWWEGHKIGKDIYTKLRARPIQIREASNPSKCYPPVIGGVMTVNSNKAMSLMDRMKPYQYIYNMIMERTLNAISLNYGKIMKVSLMDVPDGWKMSKWLNYVHNHKIWFYDPFKEGKKGAATGKLAGNMNQTSSVVDMELGSFIQYHISILEYVESQLGQIAGISPQREASISTSEKVGNVERALTQSSHITEKWFDTADYIKTEVLRVFLETCKIVYKDKDTIKAQYSMANGDTEIYTVEPSNFSEEDFDIYISNNKKDQEVIEMLKSNVQALIQNGMGDIEDLINIMTQPSIADTYRKLQSRRRERESSQAQAAKEEREYEMQKASINIEPDMKKHMDNLKLEYAKLANDINKTTTDGQVNKIKTIEELKLKSQELMLKMQELDETTRNNKEKEKIELKKANKTTTK